MSGNPRSCNPIHLTALWGIIKVGAAGGGWPMSGAPIVLMVKQTLILEATLSRDIHKCAV